MIDTHQSIQQYYSIIVNIAAGIKIDEASLRVTEDELGAAYKNCEDHTPPP